MFWSSLLKGPHACMQQIVWTSKTDFFHCAKSRQHAFVNLSDYIAAIQGSETWEKKQIKSLQNWTESTQNRSPRMYSPNACVMNPYRSLRSQNPLDSHFTLKLSFEHLVVTWVISFFHIQWIYSFENIVRDPYRPCGIILFAFNPVWQSG